MTWDTINMTYYTNGLLSERNKKYSWGQLNVTNYEYDGAGRETYSIEIQYSSDMSTKDTNSISITEYDENGLISKSISVIITVGIGLIQTSPPTKTKWMAMEE